MRSLILFVAALARLGEAGYALSDDYHPKNFLDKFNFYADKDPTEGFVSLQSRAAGLSSGIIQQRPNSVYLGVDSTNHAPNGRASLRLESKQSYSTGLVIADIAHMPDSTCGTWPAFWSIGPDWPSHGEIDIIEGVNSATSNSMTLHTLPGCTINNSGSFSGIVRTTNCDTNAPGQGSNVGCGIQTTDSSTYGSGFNAAGGGVYAMEWTASGISIWHFARNRIPADISSGNPNPSSWTRPLAHFSGNCNFQDRIRNQTLVIDTTFCGQWAGQQDVWSNDPVCSKKAKTCNDYVANNPKDFAKAYWEFNSIKVYSLRDGFIAASPAPAPPVPATTVLRIPVAQDTPTPSPSPSPAAPTVQAPIMASFSFTSTSSASYDTTSLLAYIASIESEAAASSTVASSAPAVTQEALLISASIDHMVPTYTTTAALNGTSFFANVSGLFDPVTSTSTTIISALTATGQMNATATLFSPNVTVETILFSKPAPVVTPFEPTPPAPSTMITLSSAIAFVDVTITVTAAQADVTAAFEKEFQKLIREKSPNGFIDARPAQQALGEVRGSNSNGVLRRRWWRVFG